MVEFIPEDRHIFARMPDGKSERKLYSKIKLAKTDLDQ